MDPTTWVVVSAGAGTVAAVLRTIRYRMKIRALERPLQRGDHTGAAIMGVALGASASLLHSVSPADPPADRAAEVAAEGDENQDVVAPADEASPPVLGDILDRDDEIDDGSL